MCGMSGMVAMKHFIDTWGSGTYHAQLNYIIFLVLELHSNWITGAFIDHFDETGFVSDAYSKVLE